MMARDIPDILRFTPPVSTAAPLLLDVPHSGRIYPDDFNYVCPLPVLRRMEDAYVDELVAQAPQHGAGLLVALFPRSYVDLNRAADDLDPAVIDGLWPRPLQPTARTLRGSGLVRRVCHGGVPMYDAPLSAAAVQRRLESCYHPYHALLAQELADLHARHGQVWHLNMHSMPASALLDDYHGMARRPDIILGDRYGVSCAPDFTALCAKIFCDLGFSVALNDPYSGAEIVRRHGRPATGIHSLQIEINRGLYLDEWAVAPNDGYAATVERLGEFIRQLVAALSLWPYSSSS